MIKIFSKDKRMLNGAIDTYIVEWTTYRRAYFNSINYPDVEECFQAFTDKNEAVAYAKALNSAMKLIGITALPEAKVRMGSKNTL